MVSRGNQKKAIIVSIAGSNRYLLRSRTTGNYAKIVSTSPFRRKSQEIRKSFAASSPRPRVKSTESKVPSKEISQETATNAQKSTFSPRLSDPPIRASTPRVAKAKSGKISQREITKKCYGFSPALMRRFARKMGVQRMARGCHEEIVGLLVDFLEKLAEDAVLFCQSRNSRTISLDDLHQALKCQGRRVYGYDNYDDD